jgi:energy-coupling factor transport system ATP-binding protein
MAASICASDAVARPAVSLVGYGWTPPGEARPVLDGIELELAAGECALLTGATGSGKSTLLRAIAAALPPGGSARGSLLVSGRAVLLFQDVDTQLLFSTVEEEVASGLRAAAGADERRRRSEASLSCVGLRGFARRSLADLSGGERQRVVLAALLASEPSLLLLDEPSSALDPDAREQLVAALARLKAKGHTLLIAEHLTAPFRRLADRTLTLGKGRVSPGASAPATRVRVRPRAPLRRGDAALLVEWRGVGVRDPEGRTRLSAMDLALRRGERLLVCGANGAGKSTLLHVLAGLVPASHGRIELAGALAPPGEEPRRAAPGRVALVLQNPPRNLFASSVAEELSFSLQRIGWPAERIEGRVAEILAACGLSRLRDRSPLRLSFGQQHCVAIAAALAPRPALLLLDEPFAGLDFGLRRGLLELLEREQAQTDLALVIASHAEDGLEGWAGRSVSLLATRGSARHSSESRGPAREPEGLRFASRAAVPGRACHYRDTGSLLHRVGVGWKLLAVALGGGAAIAAGSPVALAALLAVWVAGYRLGRFRWAELWQDARWLLLQGAVIVALSMLRAGSGGAAAGLHAAGQIALFFLPGALLLRTTPTGRLLDAVERVLPPRLAFALATSLRFVPFFARELHEILGVQRLRGARLAPRELWRPRAWRDAVECAGIPLAVRVIHTANEVARSAEVRGIAASTAKEAKA